MPSGVVFLGDFHDKSKDIAAATVASPARINDQLPNFMDQGSATKNIPLKQT